MKETYVRLLYLAELFQAKVVEKIKTHVLFISVFNQLVHKLFVLQ